jgi:diguanylate cyclase (GGDEF)-like protein/PAS domain S-box-containing protein
MDDHLPSHHAPDLSADPGLRLDRLIDLDALQAIQDAFAKATGVASIITDPAGRPITRASNSCRLCAELIRPTPQGRAYCMAACAAIGRSNSAGPIIAQCPGSGLWEGGARITVGDCHLGTWLVGQVLDEGADQEPMLAHGREIGADEAALRAALSEVKRLPRRQFEDICQALFLMAQQLSTLAFQNARLREEAQVRRRVEEELQEAREELGAANAEITVSNGELQGLQERFREMLSSAEFCAAILDGEGQILFCNEFLLGLVGWQAPDLMGQNWFDLLAPPEQRDRLAAGFQAFFRGEDPGCHLTYDLITKDGERRTIAWHRTLMRDARGRNIAVTGIGEDMTERLQNERAIHHLAYYDQLTQLPNRALFYDRAAQAIAHARRSGEHLGLLFIDLDFFKTINDTLGHDVGDQALRAVGQRMGQTIRGEDTLARTGGDEFVALIRSVDGTENVARSAQRLLDALQESFGVKGLEQQVSASIGIAVYPADGQDVATLLQHADMAMYWAKENGRNRYQFFAPAMNDYVHQRSQLEKDLRRALTQGEFEVYYQPICDAVEGRVSALEALLRWRHPERGLVSPGEFIPLAEETGLIGPIGAWVVAAVCAQVRKWRDQGLPARRPGLALRLFPS